MPRWVPVASMLAFFSTLCSAQSSAFSGQVPVNVSLKQELNSKYAKDGQEISAVLEQPLVLGSSTLPKGSFLLGHVVSHTPHGKDSPDGSVTVVFDHLKPKKGDPVQITASLYRIALSENQVLGMRTEGDLGGMRGSASGANATAAIRQNTDQEGRTVQGTQSASGAPVQVVSAVPGVSLSAVASADKSGIMTAHNADVTLGAGLEMVVGVAPK